MQLPITQILHSWNRFDLFAVNRLFQQGYYKASGYRVDWWPCCNAWILLKSANFTTKLLSRWKATISEISFLLLVRATIFHLPTKKPFNNISHERFWELQNVFFGLMNHVLRVSLGIKKNHFWFSTCCNSFLSILWRKWKNIFLKQKKMIQVYM